MTQVFASFAGAVCGGREVHVAVPGIKASSECGWVVCKVHRSDRATLSLCRQQNLTKEAPTEIILRLQPGLKGAIWERNQVGVDLL